LIELTDPNLSLPTNQMIEPDIKPMIAVIINNGTNVFIEASIKLPSTIYRVDGKVHNLVDHHPMFISVIV
jgi:hypothetical protein